MSTETLFIILQKFHVYKKSRRENYKHLKKLHCNTVECHTYIDLNIEHVFKAQ